MPHGLPPNPALVKDGGSSGGLPHTAVVELHRLRRRRIVTVRMAVMVRLQLQPKALMEVNSVLLWELRLLRFKNGGRGMTRTRTTALPDWSRLLRTPLLRFSR